VKGLKLRIRRSWRTSHPRYLHVRAGWRTRKRAARSVRASRETSPPAAPFLAPALAAHRPEILARIRAAVDVAAAARVPKVRPARVEGLTEALRAYFRAFAADVVPELRKADEFDPGLPASRFALPDDLWERQASALTAVLAEWYAEIGADAFGDVSALLDVSLDYALPSADVTRQIGQQVQLITEASRRDLQGKIEDAVARGYSIEQLVAGVEDDGFVGLRDLVDDWQRAAPVFTTIDRAKLIALTESANAYNLASLDGYRTSGIVEMVNVYDGGSCGWTSHTDPDTAHGSRRTLAEAGAHPIAHPHCQRAFGPIVLGPVLQPVGPPQVGPQPGPEG
jgi:hypothetical protein